MPAKKSLVFPQGAGATIFVLGPSITSTSPLPNAAINTAYSFTFTGINGTPPYTWSSTALGAFSLNPSTGAFTGTPAAAGTFSFWVQLVDANGYGTGFIPFQITVSPPSSPTITSSSPLPNATVNVAYSFTFQATGGTPPYTWTSSGTGAFSLNATTGVLTGTPTTAGTFSFTVTVTDSLNATSGPVSFQITVQPQAGTFNFFIGANGIDTNPGTLGQPWSLSAIKNNQSTYAGQKVGLIAGTYQYVNSGTGQVSIYSLLQASSGTNAIFPINGGPSTSQPTYIASCDGTGNYLARAAQIWCWDPVTGAQPTGSGTVLGQVNGQQTQGGNVTLDGIALFGATTYAIYFGPGAGGTYPYDPALGGSGGFTGITVQNCEIAYSVPPTANTNPALIGLDKGVYNALITNNLIHDSVPTTGNPGDSNGIGTFNVRGCTYSFNTIYNTFLGIHDKTQGGAAGKTGGGNVLAYNYITSPQTGISGPGYGNSGETWTVHNNIIDNSIPTNSPGFSDSSGTESALLGSLIPGFNLSFYNNTLINNYVGDPGFWQRGWSGTTFYNNIFYNFQSSRNSLLAIQNNTGPGQTTSSYVGNYNLYGDINGIADMGIVTQSGTFNEGLLPSIMPLATFATNTNQEANSIVGAATYAGPLATFNYPANYKLATGSLGIGLGRVGGVSTGAVVNAGAWDGVATQIGCNFSPLPHPATSYTQVFNYANFSSTTGIHVNSEFTVSGTALALAGTHQAGTFWYATQQNVGGGFTTTFQFSFASGLPVPAIAGMTFCIQNSNATTNPGANGSGLTVCADANGCGYGAYWYPNVLNSSQYPIGNSVAVKFDLNGLVEAYPSGGTPNAVGVFMNGGSSAQLKPDVDVNPYGINYYTGHVFQATITYDPILQLLTLVLLDTTTLAQYRNSWPMNLSAAIGGNSAWVGFSAGQVTGSANTSILNWSFSQGNGSTGAVPTLAPPTFSLPGGQYTASQLTTISGPAGASIYYTLNGLQPTSASTLYPGGNISIGANAILRAVAIKSGAVDSAVTSANYQIAAAGTPIINFPSGFASGTGATNVISLAAAAQINASNYIQLTQLGQNIQVGCAWYALPVNISSFKTVFTLLWGASAASNGLCFVIQNRLQPTLFNNNGKTIPQGGTSDGIFRWASGGTGASSNGQSGLGYSGFTAQGTTGDMLAGLQQSVAVKFDINGGSFTGIYQDGADVSLNSITTTGITLSNTNPKLVTISYDGATLSVTIKDTVTLVSFTTSATVNIISVVGSNTAYVGFTGSTGGATATQQVTTWTFNQGV